jgi:hypothetical protein
MTEVVPFHDGLKLKARLKRLLKSPNKKRNQKDGLAGAEARLILAVFIGPAAAVHLLQRPSNRVSSADCRVVPFHDGLKLTLSLFV